MPEEPGDSPDTESEESTRESGDPESTADEERPEGEEARNTAEDDHSSFDTQQRKASSREAGEQAESSLANAEDTPDSIEDDNGSDGETPARKIPADSTERGQNSSDSTDVEPEGEHDPSDNQATDPKGEHDPADSTGVNPREEQNPAAHDDLPGPSQTGDVPADVQSYDKFSKIEGGTYDRANEFLRERTYITAREWAIARLCADFRTETGVEMTKIGENLPHLVPFMTDTYSPQAVNQARHSFEEKVRKSGATFLYGAMCDFFTAEELDDVMYEATEVAKFLLEVEGVELSVEEELEAEDRITEVMRHVRESSLELRHDEVCCPECGHEFDAGTK